ncbi:Exoribonuclease phosphorolytic domain 1 [Penicillium bovifimosum]|uniref:Ribosomal RNA-processing protein 43 n=1 Tax=Penicillium bovifimosum TaxID=126998 RepID=A0A9W9L996_9EURO|nr:Exoribonuclease phosphorolytic domain 1 [Penicillium bovifimosum]KAJ5143551.1 Exoribonuclease phosphorolytic domain 1 [Penicillium bovifimosum]
MASSATTGNPMPPSLSMPPSQFARLQPHAYLRAHLSPPSSDQPSVRANGRATSQFRVTSVNTGSLTHANGSAVVRIGDTTAVCGVRAELLHTSDISSWGVSQAPSKQNPTNTNEAKDSKSEDEDDQGQIQDLNLLVPNLSLSTGCAPGLTPGAPPSALAQSLSHQILSLLHTTNLVRADDLRIWYQPPNFDSEEFHNPGEGMEVDTEQSGGPEREIKAFWVLYIDIMILSMAGNAFDAAWASVLAALRDTKLPNAWWDDDNETILCSDDFAEAHRLTLRGLPIASSFCCFEGDAAAGWRANVIPDAEEQKKKKGSQQKWILADPDGYEEGLTQERACVVVDKENGKTIIVKMEKHGGWNVDSDDLRKLVDVSSQRWDDLKQALEQC